MHDVRAGTTYRGAQLGMRAIGALSLDRALALAGRLGDAVYALDRPTRERSLEHLELVFGDRLTVEERERIARESLRNFARAFSEIANVAEIRGRFDEYVRVIGWEHAEQALSGGKGGLVVSAHMGNWELLAAYFATQRKIPIAAVARRLDDSRLNQLLVDFRAENGVETILRQDARSSRQLLRILRSGGVLAMLIDQDTMVPSITVPFLGHPARTPVAPAVLAVRRNLPTVVATSIRRPEGGLDLVLSEVIRPPEIDDRLEAITQMTRQFNDILGDAIRAHPEQWAWFHRRWRRPPIRKLDLDFAME